jgi:C4-dicarboxylate transporter DctM subunit
VSEIALAGVGFALLLGLMFIRVPIGAAMALVGMGGYAILAGIDPLLVQVKTAAYWRYSSYDLAVVPLFLLMGQFAAQAGLSKSLFDAARSLLGHYRGGIAMATIGGCAGFGAICGSSLATAATMGQVALPELRRFHYSGALATATLAAGGTLGILIPPSIVLVIYAIIVEANIAVMFQAAFIPGILAALGYMLTVALIVRFRPEHGPAAPPVPWDERWRTFLDVWPVLAIFVIVIGGIYAGIFTPSEAAAIGAFLTGAYALFRRRLTPSIFADCLAETAVSTGMIFLIVFGADMLNNFLVLTQLPDFAAQSISEAGFSPFAVLVAMILIFIVLGCVMDSLSMILLTIPIFWPVIASLDFGMTPDDTKIWFGIIALIVVELGMITPPVGINIFIVNSMARDVPMRETFAGVVPFILSDLVRVSLLVGVPAIVLFLPQLLAR